MLKHILAVASLCLGSGAMAHPHVFVQAEVELIVDQGQLTGVRLNWIYDDFFSLLLTEDLQIDPDGDLVLTEEELATLSASVTDWPPDYQGDLYLVQDAQPLALAPRQEHHATLRDGLVVETVLMPLANPVTVGDPVEVRVYDPFYYIAYSVVGDLVVTGDPNCTASYRAADLNAAYALVDELLYGRPASDVGPDEQFPEVGVHFADTVTLRCDA
jgi:ABC-type uncharacterized transport system substrate-binding protein